MVKVETIEKQTGPGLYLNAIFLNPLLPQIVAYSLADCLKDMMGETGVKLAMKRLGAI